MIYPHFQGITTIYAQNKQQIRRVQEGLDKGPPKEDGRPLMVSYTIGKEGAYVCKTLTQEDLKEFYRWLGIEYEAGIPDDLIQKQLRGIDEHRFSRAMKSFLQYYRSQDFTGEPVQKVDLTPTRSWAKLKCRIYEKLFLGH